MKSTKILIISLIFSLIVGTVSVVSLANQTDKVIVTEEVLFGDVSNVSNLTLNMKTTMENFHIWDIITPIGSAENTIVDYKLHSERQYVQDEFLEYIFLNFSNNFSSSTSAIFIFGEQKTDEEKLRYGGEFKHPELAIIDVASRTEFNSKHTEIINLKDYYEFYLLGFNAFLEIKSDENYEIFREFSTEAIEKIDDFFKIPVSDDKLEISITKNDLGVNKIECQSIGVTTEILNYSVVLDDQIFLVLEVNEVDGEEVTKIRNTEMYNFDIFIKDGYIEIDEISKIKTFDDEIHLEGFIEFGDFLVTIETKSFKSEFVVYSKEDFTEIQRISIRDNGYYLRNLGNAILIYHSDDIFTVITEENGIFNKNYDGQFKTVMQYQEGNYYYGSKEFFVDNQLIVLTEYRKPINPMGDIVMSVYSEDGIQFTSRYSLSQLEETIEFANDRITFEDFYVE